MFVLRRLFAIDSVAAARGLGDTRPALIALGHTPSQRAHVSVGAPLSRIVSQLIGAARLANVPVYLLRGVADDLYTGSPRLSELRWIERVDAEFLLRLQADGVNTVFLVGGAESTALCIAEVALRCRLRPVLVREAFSHDPYSPANDFGNEKQTMHVDVFRVDDAIASFFHCADTPLVLHTLPR